MKQPTISEVQINGRRQYRLTFWEHGKRKRSHFALKADAEERQAQVLAEFKKHGTNWIDLPILLRVQAVEARTILAGSGLTLPEAARLALGQQAKKSVPLEDAVAEFVHSRQYRGQQYYRALGSILGAFVVAYPARTQQSISTGDVDLYLDGIAGRASITHRNYVRTILSMFFERGITLGSCTANPVKLTRKIKAVPAKIEILTPAECRKILEACDPRILAGVVLRLFCFIRGAEMHRLDWESVTLTGAEPQVLLSAKITKTATTRKVSIPACALSWLPKKRPQGMVFPESQALRQLWDKARLEAGFGPFVSYRGETPKKKLKPWPNNALRHTGISYLLATTQNLNLASYQAGNSASVIRQHYDGLATSKAAQVHFSTFRR